MTRFAAGIISGVTMGLLVGAGVTMTTDERQRRRFMRDSRRAMRKAGHYFGDMLDD